MDEWRDAVVQLSEMGWAAEEIEAICKGLNRLCEEGAASDPTELTSAQVEEIAGADLSDEETSALQEIATAYGSDDDAAAEIRELLLEIDGYD